MVILAVSCFIPLKSHDSKMPVMTTRDQQHQPIIQVTKVEHYELSRYHKSLGGGFKYLLFSPLSLGKIPILTNIFQMG